MNRLFKGFTMSLSMFSILPAPKVWDSGAFCWVIPTFPLVGLIIGALWYTMARLLLLLPVPEALRASALLLFPLFLSGFIHVDGFMDTCDAVFSRAELSRKRDILKDSHVGAFAAIALGVYLLVGYSAALGALERNANLPALIFIPALSRCAAGIALLYAKPMSETGFGADFSRDTKHMHRIVTLCIAVMCFAVGCLSGGERIFYALAGLLLGGVLSAEFSVRQLDGISGDLCGFIITVSELCALVFMAVI